MGSASTFDIVILVIGIAILLYGLVICILRKPALTLDYNWEKVKEEDINKYTIAYGIAYSIMGAVMALLSVSHIFIEGNLKKVAAILYFVAYFIFMSVTKRIQKKYTGSN